MSCITTSRSCQKKAEEIKFTTPGSSVVNTVVSAIAYLPFGPAGATTCGNGDTLRRTFDQAYRPTGVVSMLLYLQYALDAFGNPVALTDAPAHPCGERAPSDDGCTGVVLRNHICD